MHEIRRSSFKHAILQQHVGQVEHQNPVPLELRPSRILVQSFSNSPKHKIVLGLIAVGFVHVGIWAITAYSSETIVKEKAQPVIVEIVPPEPIKPEIIPAQIPPMVEQPKPEPVVEPKIQPEPKPVPQPEPRKITPAPVLTAKADAPVETHTVATAEPQVAAEPTPQPKQENVVVTEAKGYAGYLSNPAPEYPEVALDRGWEGRVVLRILVSASGTPLEMSVKQSSGKKVLDDTALRTVKRWKFSPAKRGSTAIEGWVDVPIDFKLPK